MNMRHGGEPRLAVLCDYPEEGWPSMDLCAEMLLAQPGPARGVTTARLCPPFRRRLGLAPWLRRTSWARNGDRFLNRHWYYPRHLRRRRRDFDLFHVCDHSYGQLVLELPGARTGVFCHDLDAFRCLLEPVREPRPRWFRSMMRRVLEGLRKAAVVFHATQAVREEILQAGLIDPERLVYAPLGYAPEFTTRSVVPQCGVTAEAAPVFEQLGDRPYVLHVGSCIPRKRVDFLLRVFADVRSAVPEVRLVKVGGAWSVEQRGLIRALGLEGCVVHVHGLSRATLAALYRRAALVALPSTAEGFGLPVLEALACGAPVLASDIPAFREVGGAAVSYAPPLDGPAWRERAVHTLTRPHAVPDRAACLAQAQRFSWEEHARIIFATYRKLAG